MPLIKLRSSSLNSDIDFRGEPTVSESLVGSAIVQTSEQVDQTGNIAVENNGQN